MSLERDLDELDPDVKILSVTFGDELVEVSFIDRKDETAFVVDVTVRQIRVAALTDKVMAVLQELRELVDAADVVKVAPPQSFIGRR